MRYDKRRLEIKLPTEHLAQAAGLANCHRWRAVEDYIRRRVPICPTADGAARILPAGDSRFPCTGFVDRVGCPSRTGWGH